MRKVIHLAIMLIMLIFIACSQDFEFRSQTSDSKVNLEQLSTKQTCLDSIFKYHSWKEMAEDCLHGNAAVWLNNQGLKLSSYELTDEKILVKDSLFGYDQNTLLPMYSCNYSKVEKMQKYTCMTNNLKNEYLSFKRKLLNLYANQILGKVKFVWEYNGSQIVTYGYVANNVIVYDDILMNLKEIKTYDINYNLSKRRMISRAETTTGEDSYTFSSERLTLHFLGREVASACASFEIKYMSGDFLVDEKSNSHSEGVWTALAKTEHTVTGKVCTVKYVAAVGTGTITVTEDDYKFNVVGAQKYESSSKSYHASQFSGYGK